LNESAFLFAVRGGWLVLIGGLLLAVVSDQRERRIPNAMTLPLMALGLVWHASVLPGLGLFDSYTTGGLGLAQSAIGAGVALAVFFLFYALRLLGAGDVKLIAAVGAWVGGKALLPVVLAILLAGGVISLVRLIDTKRRLHAIGNLRLIGLQMAGGSGGAALFDPRRDTADRLPYAWAIAGGTILYGLARHFEWVDWL
jgi:prepilin peptidase CpaA